jgi:hypothetical protein
MVGRSFATSKVDPGDADILTIIDYTEIDALPAPKKILLSGLFHGHKTRENCRCDSYLLVEYPLGHRGRTSFERGRKRWADLFGSVRDDPKASKGFVVVSS